LTRSAESESDCVNVSDRGERGDIGDIPPSAFGAVGVLSAQGAWHCGAQGWELLSVGQNVDQNVDQNDPNFDPKSNKESDPKKKQRGIVTAQNGKMCVVESVKGGRAETDLTSKGHCLVVQLVPLRVHESLESESQSHESQSHTSEGAKERGRESDKERERDTASSSFDSPVPQENRQTDTDTDTHAGEDAMAAPAVTAQDILRGDNESQGKGKGGEGDVQALLAAPEDKEGEERGANKASNRESKGRKDKKRKERGGEGIMLEVGGQGVCLKGAAGESIYWYILESRACLFYRWKVGICVIDMTLSDSLQR